MKTMTKEQQLVYRWSIAITRADQRGIKFLGRRGGNRGYPNNPKFLSFARGPLGHRLTDGDTELKEANYAGVEYALKNP